MSPPKEIRQEYGPVVARSVEPRSVRAISCALRAKGAPGNLQNVTLPGGVTSQCLAHRARGCNVTFPL